ncbi:BrnA antitoxin family protein [Geothrix sp. 21YS21S-2]|uniref:BrnA antitoxin family protein n=1 Tax=Geothrix sp. 21YS21S-2 TaxID=3068893 RepID=UPI00358ED62D
MRKPRARPDHISQEDWDSVDSPPLSEEMLARLRPVSETHPEILKARREGGLKGRGPQKAPTKTLLSMRYSPEVLDYFRASGPGWQTRMDEALKQWIQDHPARTSSAKS